MFSTKYFVLFAIIFTFYSNNSQADDYQVQVGDLIKITLSGEKSLEEPFEVDRLGRLMLPEVGAVQVAGLSEQEMSSHVSKMLSKAFRDLSQIEIYVFKKQMLISVQGYVNEPGEYILPANASVQTALHAAGGLRAGAQLNRMQLKNSASIKIFNYKNYLDSGNDSLLPQLHSLDEIFVPASPMIGNVEVNFDPAKVANSGDAAEGRNAIKVFGEVNSPGSFSFKADMNLVDLLMRAGGVTRYAGVEQIRVITQGEPTLFNLKQYLDSGNDRLLPQIKVGSTIFVPFQEEEVKTGANMVYVMGEVAKPGAYETQADASFMDILANSGGPTRYAESRQIRIIKADGSVVAFDLAGYTEGTIPGSPPAVVPGDAIFVPEKSDMNEKSWLKITPNRAVRVLGEVKRPSRVEWADEMSLLDLLAHVGGPTSRADTSNIEIVTPLTNGKTKKYNFNLDKFIKAGHSDAQLPLVRAGSTIRIHDLPQDPRDNKSQWVRQSSEKSIYIFGQVGAPGRYMFTEDLNFLDILAAADGPNVNADIHNIRVTHRNGDYAKVSKLNLSLYFETGDESLIPDVKMGDTIYIPEKDRSWLDQSKESTIRVLGAVNKPGRYRFNDSMTILDLLAEAGGPSNVALVEQIVVVNTSCCIDQARTFDLAEFSRTAKFTMLPVIRNGDTVYVPNKSDSNLAKFRAGLRDAFEMISLGSLIGLL